MANNIPVDILFYGDGELLYRANNVTTTMPHDFSVNVNGVTQLTIKVSGRGGTFDDHYIALTDLALYK